MKAQQMAAMYFENVAPINHFVHMPTSNSWLNDMLQEYKGVYFHPVGKSKRAVICSLVCNQCVKGLFTLIN